MNLLKVIGVNIKPKSKEKPVVIEITDSDHERYLQKGGSDLRIAIDVRGYDEVNRFLSGFIGVLKQYHPFNLIEPERCYFTHKPTTMYIPPHDFKFDIDNPTIPRDVYDDLENGRFTISLSDDGQQPFCFWLQHSDGNIHDIFWSKDNAGKGFRLQLQCVNPIVRTELVNFIFGFGGKVKAEKYI